MLNKYIDHTLLKADATEDQIIRLCKEAIKYDFAAVCVNSYYVPLAVKFLKDTSINICTVVGFPLGASPTSTKIQEAQFAIQAGATEIDMVINIGALRDAKDEYVLSDIIETKEACHKAGAILKVIIETSYLNEEEKIKASQIVSQSGADYIKTSTGFGGGGATFEDVKLIKANISGAIKIKASGGVRDLETAKKMIDLGVSRIGTSSGLAICSN